MVTRGWDQAAEAQGAAIRGGKDREEALGFCFGQTQFVTYWAANWRCVIVSDEETWGQEGQETPAGESRPRLISRPEGCHRR